MSDIKVSVLVTFYNQQKYVDRALQSIFSQIRDFNIQVVVGDDGSTDDTIYRINNWLHCYPNEIDLHIMSRDRSKQIAGFRASQNRINLLKYVKGDYFIFLDGDDYFSDENKLKLQVEILEKKVNQDCIACAHNIEALFPDGKRIALSGNDVKEGKYSVEQYWSQYYFHTDTLLIRSVVIPKLPLEIVENNFNDNMITYLVFQHGLVYYIPQIMAVYLQTGDGIWTSGKVMVNNIRNLFLFDICIMVNPSLEKASAVRFFHEWENIYRSRLKMDFGNKQEFYLEAKNKKLLYSSLWLQYNDLTYIKKLKLICKRYSILIIYLMHKIKKRLRRK